jgi:hypothetical protein
MAPALFEDGDVARPAESESRSCSWFPPAAQPDLSGRSGVVGGPRSFAYAYGVDGKD